MFSGIGGFELGINKALQPTTCVGYSEIDKYAIQIYEKNYPRKWCENCRLERDGQEVIRLPGGQKEVNSAGTHISQTKRPDGYVVDQPHTESNNCTCEHRNFGDAATINATELPDFDLLVGGFPCQAFSIAGKRRGFEDTRGTLFFDIARILRAKQPTNFILENVKGLLSHDNGQTFRTIVSTLTELGYDIEWQVLNSKNFGVPQNRERVFIIGHLRGTSRPEVFSIRKDDAIYDGLYRKEQDILSNEAKGNGGGSEHIDSEIVEDEQVGQLHQLNNPTHSNDRVYGSDGISPTLNTMQGGNRQPKVMAWSKSVGTYKGKTRNEQRIKTNGEFNTLSTGEGGGSFSSKNFINEEMKIRRLTPLECERLQGFPDGWTEGVSDTQRYKMMGNAVTVNVVEYIIKNIK